MVDCSVCGTDVGTSDKPKFSLASFWKKEVIPVLERLVGEGGRYEGYKVLVQGDNAGPHKQGSFDEILKEELESRGMILYNQPPNG